MNVLDIFKKTSAQGLSTNRFALAIRWTDRLLIHPEHPGPSGVHVISGPWILLAPDVPDRDLGHELVMSLRSSRKVGIDMLDFSKLHAERCRLAGVRTERDLALGALFVQVHTTPEMIVLVPTRSGVSGHGMELKPLEDRRIELELDAPEDLIGKRLRRAWQACSLI